MSCCVGPRVLFWVLALTGATADVASKYGIFAWLSPNQERVLVPGVFSLVHQATLNQGALFGLAGQHGGTANLLFAIFSALAVVLISTWAMRSSAISQRGLSFSLTLIMAGALGNLYDRVFFGGVRDFLWLYYQRVDGSRLSWPVFNLADSFLVCGAALLLFHAYITQPATAPAAGQSQETQAA
jgi:signal peptidase II